MTGLLGRHTGVAKGLCVGLVCVCERDDFEQTCVGVYVEDGVCCCHNIERRCVIDCGVWKNGLPSCAVEPEAGRSTVART